MSLTYRVVIKDTINEVLSHSLSHNDSHIRRPSKMTNLKLPLHKYTRPAWPQQQKRAVVFLVLGNTNCFVCNLNHI